MANNVVDFVSKKKEKEATLAFNNTDYAHQLTCDFANDIVNDLDDMGIDPSHMMETPEMILFLEAMESFICSCLGVEHPFQELAKQIIKDEEIEIELMIDNPDNDEE